MHPSRFSTRWLLAVSLVASSGVLAATLYRWTDDQGQVHYSDAVPDEYKSRARPLNLPPAEPEEADRREALERAARDRAKISPSRSPKAVAAPSAPVSEASEVKKRPAQVPTADTDCETWQRLYLESSDCFGPYRTARGGIKPEAFEHCTEVAEPPPRCRLRMP